ncbi:TetR/AcrR family transcriptional regulator [Paractinoplanes atraurantiacus]|uniref:DNA-binding transcriptional regulator, AcrR family n=1 Tax=Paractinoplanes atraurantiacus TaxID=1036182 RepID=A0A285JX23_9ACTN|nr:TetR/AcrR family transcriptional regulator [Actinoplanes atraurantiacus]SNY64838.1 DNA-binding transcriptional regulator, AcrR family [Actinoplanes atraurantiacus]
MHRGNRHGRSEQARLAVLQAADDLLVENGFARLTVEGIAQRAGVAKQTIYRWWPSKTDILFEALVTDAAEEITPPDTGDPTRDLVTHLCALARFLTASDAGAVFRALTAEGQHDPALAARLREEHLTGQRTRDRQLLERAVQRGDLPVTADLDTIVDRLVGPLYYRALITGQEITTEFVTDLVSATLKSA